MAWENRRLVVVGGSGGIGSAIVRGAASQGAKVFFTYYRGEEQARQLVEAFPSGAVRCAPLNVSDYAAVEGVMEEARSWLGRIDALINTVGALRELRFLEDMSPGAIEDTLRTELLGVIYPMKVVLPWMKAQNHGRIVTVGSDSGKVGSKAEAASSAARGGVIAWSKAVAREVATYDISINVVCPGPTDTELLQRMRSGHDLTQRLMEAMIRAIPKRRPARPEEVATVALFLADEPASYITGQAVSVSGGLTMC